MSTQIATFSLPNLALLAGPEAIRNLNEQQLKELQGALSQLGYPIGEIDGMFGPRTRNAWAEFKADVYPGSPDLIGAESVFTLKAALEQLPSLAKADFSSKTGTILAIRQECAAQGIGLATQVAYVLATTQWETAQTFKPVKEAFWLSEAWRQQNLRYYPFYGRGFVQLTWESNYKKYANLLSIDLVQQPDLALEPSVALFILVHGFKTGLFTGRKITDYINSNQTDFINARRCINGMDKAHEIAEIAKSFL